MVKVTSLKKKAMGWGGLSVGVVAIAFLLSNPGPEQYEDYAVDRLTEALEQEICNDLPPQFQQFSDQCRSVGKTLIDISEPQLETLIGKNTQRYNYGLFSIYHTTLSLKPFTPTYEFETVGILQQFYIYSVEER
ncbi:DUF4359 domain-containing protein [Spirulina sp. CS-785/01]|uniref:DUF4359 domain-containing protein n=1 Tax=Spirulina sp. CS-785/01 TaxID=3021716 RepID=UPI00232CDBAD|nr:DUF4359 domain-containing protein [Spirulina sp. CS-785/01]MDB9314048.1 DUF4359 domain-containing protein [Spirulina sp. CS-785/01]